MVVTVEGFTSAEILALPRDDVDSFLFSQDSVVIRAGSAELLGRFQLRGSSLVIELAHIDGGGEGVLPTLSALAVNIARARGLNQVEWLVHALHCANPNPKLRRVLERRGFSVRSLPEVGQVYYQLVTVPSTDPVI